VLTINLFFLINRKLLKESYNKRKQSYEKEELRHSMTLQKLPTTLLKRRQYIRRGNEYLLSTNTNLRKTSIQKRPTVEESLHDTTLQTFFNQTQEYILNYTNRFVPPWYVSMSLRLTGYYRHMRSVMLFTVQEVKFL
jgi:hypothetical protein